METVCQGLVRPLRSGQVRPIVGFATNKHKLFVSVFCAMYPFCRACSCLERSKKTFCWIRNYSSEQILFLLDVFNTFKGISILVLFFMLIIGWILFQSTYSDRSYIVLMPWIFFGLTEVWLYNTRPGQIFWPNLPRGMGELTPLQGKLGHYDPISLTEDYPLM